MRAYCIKINHICLAEKSKLFYLSEASSETLLKIEYKVTPYFFQWENQEKKIISQNLVCHLLLRVVSKMNEKLYYSEIINSKCNTLNITN
jgi:hypothetical protein